MCIHESRRLIYIGSDFNEKCLKAVVFLKLEIHNAMKEAGEGVISSICTCDNSWVLMHGFVHLIRTVSAIVRHCFKSKEPN